MPNLSPEFIENMRALLGAEVEDFLRALERPPALALRAHRGAEAAAPFVSEPVPWAENGFYRRDSTRPGASIEHWAGAFYLQEASAMLPATVLAARPGERVLDLCAAPGGKASQIAWALQGKGALVANEIEPARARVLAANLERLGVCNAVAVNESPARLAACWPGAFDAVLVDAPCSGEGMFRRDPESRAQWTSSAPQGCQKRQAEVLDAAAALVRPGGRLVYSTCTFNNLENEGSVAGFLQRHPDFAPWDFEVPTLGASAGGMLRLWPHRARGDGHFVARFRKAGAGETPQAERDARSQRARRDKASAGCKGNPDPRALLAALLQTAVSALPAGLESARLRLSGRRLFAVPILAPDTDGLRAVSPGLALLRAEKGRVEPEHALAMALKPEMARRTAALDESEALAFIAGEALPREGEAGWTLVTYKNLPLGWGKQAEATLKNHVPKGLRAHLRP